MGSGAFHLIEFESFASVGEALSHSGTVARHRFEVPEVVAPGGGAISASGSSHEEPAGHPGPCGICLVAAVVPTTVSISSGARCGVLNRHVVGISSDAIHSTTSPIVSAVASATRVGILVVGNLDCPLDVSRGWGT